MSVKTIRATLAGVPSWNHKLDNFKATNAGKSVRAYRSIYPCKTTSKMQNMLSAAVGIKKPKQRALPSKKIPLSSFFPRCQAAQCSVQTCFPVTPIWERHSHMVKFLQYPSEPSSTSRPSSPS